MAVQDTNIHAQIRRVCYAIYLLLLLAIAIAFGYKLLGNPSRAADTGIINASASYDASADLATDAAHIQYTWTPDWLTPQRQVAGTDRSDSIVWERPSWLYDETPRKTLLAEIRRRARRDTRYATLLETEASLPNEILVLSLKNTEALDFCNGYAANIANTYDASAIDLTDELAGTLPPHLLQWDPRWGYAAYGTSTLGLSGCGPTSLSIVVLTLTGDTQANPLAVAEYSASQNWYVEGVGTDWALMQRGAAHYGLRVRDVQLGDETMRNALDNGELLIASLGPGDFTDNGHFIVIRGYVPSESADTQGSFLIIDPNSRIRTDALWPYETLLAQINGLWAYQAY